MSEADGSSAPSAVPEHVRKKLERLRKLRSDLTEAEDKLRGSRISAVIFLLVGNAAVWVAAEVPGNEALYAIGGLVNLLTIIGYSQVNGRRVRETKAIQN